MKIRRQMHKRLPDYCGYILCDLRFLRSPLGVSFIKQPVDNGFDSRNRFLV